MLSQTAFITVVMPVRNEARFIQDTLGQLLAQDYPASRYEIFVVDGMSDDSTRSIVEDMAKLYPQIRMINNPARLSSAGRNLGFRNGRGDCFLVVDGHCFIPTNKLFSNVTECFEKSGADCLGRPQPLDPPGLTRFQRAVALARGSKLGHGGDSLIYSEYEGFASPVSNGAAYKREVFDKAGYVDENFDAAEDVEFNYRVEKAGLSCYTSPLLTVRYYPRESLSALFRQMQRYGLGRRKFTRKHPEALTLNQLIPVGLVLGLMLLAVCGVTSSLSLGVVKSLSDSGTQVLSVFSATAFLLAVYSLYALIIIAESVRIAARNGWCYLKYIPLILFTVHFGLGWGFVRQSLSR